ncbi:unnamed protein product, partial [Effrenium voratum]
MAWSLCALALTLVEGNELTPDDLNIAKVFLDLHVFNGTLEPTRSPMGEMVFMSSAEKAKAQGLAWPVNWPTLCFLGLGSASVELFIALTRLFPELQIVLLEVQDPRYLAVAAKELLVDARHFALRPRGTG